MLAMRNNTSYIKRDLMAEVLRLIFQGRLPEKIDSLPPRMFPRNSDSVRCCVYKDRAMIRYRLLGIMGFSLEEDDDDTLLLRDYAERALDPKEESPDKTALTMLNMVCSSCVGGKYNVTDLCRGCVARPCQVNCPKDAIKIINGRSIIDEEKCINCGKCQKLCPYNAIVYTPLPCSENCPVDALERTKDGGMRINYDKCISCGNCTRSCPFGAVVERSDIVNIARAMDGKKTIKALVAPSLYGQFPYDQERLNGAIVEAGFSEIVEVATGAEETAHREAEEFIENRERGLLPLTNSCCPAWKETVEKHIPSLAGQLSHTPSPMAITGDAVKGEDPQAITVFIGPCLAKKNEARRLDSIDYTMTFEELGAFFMARDIEVSDCDPVRSVVPDKLPLPEKTGRGFAREGGVSGALGTYLGEEIILEKVDGLDRKKIRRLANHEKLMGGCEFIEVMCCEGGCLGGPGSLSPLPQSVKRLENFIREKEEKPVPV